MSLSRENSQNPGLLLFQHLQSKCDTDEKRKAAIVKIMGTKGGIDTVKKAIVCCKPMMDKYHTEIDPLKKARETAKYDREENVNMGDREYPCFMDIGYGGPAEDLDRKIKMVDEKFKAILSIYNPLTYAVHNAEYEERKAAEAAKKAAAENAAARELEFIQELTQQQFSR